jgi:hypothetical protein
VLPATVVLVEGGSDQLAVEALALRSGRDLAAEGVLVRPIGGAGNVATVLAGLPTGTRVLGLCDAREAVVYRRAGSFEFFVCDADLEDELIRALGVEAVLAIVEAEGELRAFRTLQQQPAQVGRGVDQQLRRFFGTRSGRKHRYAPLLVGALGDASVPAPLRDLLLRLEVRPRRGARPPDP